jgi:NADPH-dependent 2,4-dienoyl-CoA reductase/sulfur reductase-like enzyme/rhodanese-related sulfurtransferase
MRIVIIGAVAAGTSAAAKARRNNEDAHITLYEMDKHTSYSGCGLPYFIGGEVESIEKLTPRDAAFFKSKYNVDIFTRHEVLSIDAAAKELTVRNLVDGSTFMDKYDALVLATGASPVVPPILGVHNGNVFILRNPSHAVAIREYIKSKNPNHAVIIGSGFIGLEMAENLVRAGLDVTVVEKLPHICQSLDDDMSGYVQQHLEKRGVKIITGRSAAEITDNTVLLDDGSSLVSDLVILSVGVRPNVKLAKQMGVELGSTGAIKVDERMQTNLPDVYSCGDCAQSWSILNGAPLYRPLGSTANKMGRIAGDVITGGDLRFRGILGTSIFRVFDMTVATTGMSEAEARQKGHDIVISHNTKPNKPEYYGGSEMVIKAIADRQTEKLLGVQIVGYEGVDKRIDVFITAITLDAKVSDLFHLDLAYAPPFSTTKDPVMYTGMILDNAINRDRGLLTPTELIEQGEDQFTVIDTRVDHQYLAGHVDGAKSMPHESIRDRFADIPQNKPIVTYCNKGVTGNAVQNVLLNRGFKKVYNLSGGYNQYKIQKGRK